MTRCVCVCCGGGRWVCTVWVGTMALITLLITVLVCFLAGASAAKPAPGAPPPAPPTHAPPGRRFSAAFCVVRCGRVASLSPAPGAPWRDCGGGGGRRRSGGLQQGAGRRGGAAVSGSGPQADARRVTAPPPAARRLALQALRSGLPSSVQRPPGVQRGGCQVARRRAARVRRRGEDRRGPDDAAEARLGVVDRPCPGAGPHGDTARAGPRRRSRGGGLATESGASRGRAGTGRGRPFLPGQRPQHRVNRLRRPGRPGREGRFHLTRLLGCWRCGGGGDGVVAVLGLSRRAGGGSHGAPPCPSHKPMCQACTRLNRADAVKADGGGGGKREGRGGRKCIRNWILRRIQVSSLKF